MSNTTTQLVWNGCDGYLDIESATARFGDYDIERHEDGSGTLYARREKFNSFPTVEVSKAEVPTDDDGEMNFDGLFVTEYMRIFRAVENA